MYPLALAFFFAGIASIFYPQPDMVSSQTAKADAQGRNFAIYRNAVCDYATTNPTFVGTVPESSLLLPSGYKKTGTWINMVEVGGTIYVYASVERSGQMASNVIDALSGNNAVGIKDAFGRIISTSYGDLGVTAPAYIPEDAVVSFSSR